MEEHIDTFLKALYIVLSSDSEQENSNQHSSSTSSEDNTRIVSEGNYIEHRAAFFSQHESYLNAPRNFLKEFVGSLLCRNGA